MGGRGGQTLLLFMTMQLSGTLFGKCHTIKLPSRFLCDTACSPTSNMQSQECSELMIVLSVHCC